MTEPVCAMNLLIQCMPQYQAALLPAEKMTLGKWGLMAHGV